MTSPISNALRERYVPRSISEWDRSRASSGGSRDTAVSNSSPLIDSPQMSVVTGGERPYQFMLDVFEPTCANAFGRQATASVFRRQLQQRLSPGASRTGVRRECLRPASLSRHHPAVTSAIGTGGNDMLAHVQRFTGAGSSIRSVARRHRSRMVRYSS